MSVMKEFRDFAVKGNVVDMAVGIIIGAGFGEIVKSLVADVIMPPIGSITGGVNFSDLKLTLPTLVGSTAPVTVNYGHFIQTIFNFIIVAFSMFMVIKAMNKVKRKEEAVAPAPKPTAEEVVLLEIRDILKAGAPGLKKAV